MRTGITVGVGLLLAIGASLAMWAAIHEPARPFCQIIDRTLIRTNADERQINQAIADTLDPLLPPPSAEGGLRLAVREWDVNPGLLFSGDDYARWVREQTDSKGETIRVEVIRGEAMPSLVFVEHSSKEAAEEIAREVTAAFDRLGVEVRDEPRGAFLAVF